MTSTTNIIPGTMESDRRRVLIVDDDESISRVFKLLILNDLPHLRVDTAKNGAEAIHEFCQGHQGVLVMDLYMPVMDGLTAYTKISELCVRENWEEPAVVFCTGYIPPDSLRSLVITNPDHCLLQKPVLGRTIVEAVRVRLERSAVAA